MWFTIKQTNPLGQGKSLKNRRNESGQTVEKNFTRKLLERLLGMRRRTGNEEMKHWGLTQIQIQIRGQVIGHTQVKHIRVGKTLGPGGTNKRGSLNKEKSK